jgi:hypothetical protein
MVLKENKMKYIGLDKDEFKNEFSYYASDIWSKHEIKEVKFFSNGDKIDIDHIELVIGKIPEKDSTKSRKSEFGSVGHPDDEW